MLDDLLEAREALERSRGGVPLLEELRTFLRLSREARVRNAEDVAKYGTLLLDRHGRKLGEEELWLLHEQTAVALLECGDPAAAMPLIRQVLVRFPDAIRAKRLQGLYYEAVSKPERALALYEEALEAQPHNDVLPKRLAALHRGAGQLGEAIDVLRTYVDTYSNDREAWEELADCYLEACLYRQAAFCLEEVLSMGVLMPAALVRYADVLASIGGGPQLQAARAYYATALQVTGGRSARALYGLLAVANALGNKDAAATSAAAAELPAAAASALLQLYSQAAPGKLPLVQQAVSRFVSR